MGDADSLEIEMGVIAARRAILRAIRVLEAGGEGWAEVVLIAGGFVDDAAHLSQRTGGDEAARLAKLAEEVRAAARMPIAAATKVLRRISSRLDPKEA